MKYSGVIPLVHKLNLFHSFGKDSQVCVGVGKMAVGVFVTQCRVCQQKQNFPEGFCLQNKLFANKSIQEPRYPWTWPSLNWFCHSPVRSGCYYCSHLTGNETGVERLVTCDQVLVVRWWMTAFQTQVFPKLLVTTVLYSSREASLFLHLWAGLSRAYERNHRSLIIEKKHAHSVDLHFYMCRGGWEQCLEDKWNPNQGCVYDF